LKKTGKTWVLTNNKRAVVNWLELDMGYITKMSLVLPAILEILEKTQPTKVRS
jgi:hypothetical protein